MFLEGFSELSSGLKGISAVKFNFIMFVDRISKQVSCVLKKHFSNKTFHLKYFVRFPMINQKNESCCFR